jgi:outer membrane protein assembly factor BamB
MPNTTAAETDKVTIVSITNLGTGHQYNDIALSGDGNYIFAGTYENLASNITLIQVPDSFETDQDLVWKIDVGRAKNLVISSNASRLIYTDTAGDSIVSLNRDSITPEWVFNAPGTMGKAALSANGEYLVYSYFDTVIYKILGVNAVDNSPLWNYESESVIMGLDVSDNGKFIVSLSNGTIIYFDTAGYVWDDAIQIGCISPRLNADGSRVLVSNQTGEESISLYDGSGTILWSFTDELLSNDGYDLAQNSDSGEIIVATYDSSVPANNKIYRLNASTGSPIWITNTGIKQNKARISANGRIAIVSDYEHNIYLINMQTGELIMTHPRGYSIGDVVINDDGTIAAAIDFSGTLMIYSIDLANDDNGTGDPTDTSTGFLAKFLNGFTNLDNIYSLGATLVVGLMIGGLVFGLRKKK